MLRVERVTEVDRDHPDVVEEVKTDFELVHRRRARWEMGITGVKEGARESFGPPNPGLRPHTQSVLD